MNYIIRYITTEKEIKEAKEIYTSHKKVMRTLMDRKDKDIETNDENIKLIGCFLNDILVAFLKISIFPNLPYYQIGNMNIKHGILNRYDFTNSMHPIIPIMDFILQEQEKQQRFTWFYNRSLTNAYHKLQLDGKDLLKNCLLGYDKIKQQYRYDRFVEAVIKAGGKPKHLAYQAMQNKVFDTDYMIVKCCLKNEYRDTPDYFDNKVIANCLKTTKQIKDI